MNKYLVSAVLFAAPFAVLAQDVPPEASTLEQIIIAVVAGIGGFVIGWVIKGMRALETLVANSPNKVDDKALELLKKALGEALNPPALKK